MTLRVYNTLTHEKEPLETVQPGKIGIYLCGPTVYKPSHIGHAVGPIIFDVVKKYLVYKGYEVTFVVNITDVDDKLIEEAEAQNTTVPELAERITRNYLDSMDRLNIHSIDIMPKASEHIGDIVGIIEKLIAAGSAYPSNGDVYFDVSTHPDYGKLSNRKKEDQVSERALEGQTKRNPGDFALWKSAKPHEPAEVRYDSPWSSGRPGWHIECSVMSTRYLGDTFDIHGGGMDLIFPHHENEIAQAEMATGQPFAKYWLHNGLTRFNTKKVSKSDVEMQEALKKMTLSTLLDHYGGELLRYFVLSTHYRRPIEFSDQELESKNRGLASFHRLFERIGRVCGQDAYSAQTDWANVDRGAYDSFAADVDQFLSKFHEAMCDDFNTAVAIAAMFDLSKRINRFVEDEKLESGGNEAGRRMAFASACALIELGRLLGLFVVPPERKSSADDEFVGKLMDILIEARAAARKAKQFELSDMIRDRLSEAGVTLEDRTEGTGWRR